MEVVKSNDVNYPSKDLMYFRFKDNNILKGERRPQQELPARREENRAPVCKYNPSTFLLVWGCGEFGQHGHAINGDVTLDRSLAEHDSGRLLLEDETPAITACGSSHTLVLSNNGKLYSWGNGTSGQLGNGTSETVCKPMPVTLQMDTEIQGMACGARHSFIWTADGCCYSFGNNFNAQLGYNFSKVDFKENQLQPVLVELLPHMTVREVACGARHTLFLLTTGHVLAVGFNQQGQIGNGSTDDVVIPTKLNDLSNISHIACGDSHSLASDEDTGQLYAWGYGKAFGMKSRHVVSPKSISLHGKDNGAVVSLAGGDSHSMVLYQNGVLYTWGNNYEGQLGLGESIKSQSEPKPIPNSVLPRPVVQISCGETTCAALTGEGKLYMWGKNADVIHTDKPSQYFQFEPYHIETEDKHVTQVSCGAWHVTAIVKLFNTTDNQEIESNNNDLVEEEVFIQPNIQVHSTNITKESFTDNAKLSSCELDFETEQGLATENNMLETICNNLNLGDKRVSCNDDLITNIEELPSCGDGYVDNTITLSMLTNTYDENGHSVDHFDNNVKETGSFNRDQSKQEMVGKFQEELIKKIDNEPMNYHDKVLDSSADYIYNYDKSILLTDVVQPVSKQNEGFKTKLHVDESVETSSKEEPAKIDHETFNHVLELDTAYDISSKGITTQRFISEDTATQSENSEGFETDIDEMVEKSSREEPSQKTARESVTHHNVINLGSANNTYNSKTMCDSILTEDTQNIERYNEPNNSPIVHRIVPNISAWRRIKQHKRVFRQNSTAHKSSKGVDTNVSFLEQQAMPIINQNFRSSLEKITASKDHQQKKRKPCFSSRNMWNSSNLLREKQSKMVLTRLSRSDSETDFILESMLPNRPTHAASKKKKWAKFKDSPMAYVESTKQVPKNAICNHSGKLLPPICSCRSRNKSSLGKQYNFRNAFIERK